MGNPNEEVAEFVDHQLKLFAGIFAEVRTLSNIFIFAGYGAFFGLWNITKDGMWLSTSHLVAALLMLVSVTIYATLEIGAVCLNAVVHARLGRIYQKADEFDSVKSVQNAIAQSVGRYQRVAPTFQRIWFVAFVLTVLTGLSACVVLGWSFVDALTHSVAYP